MGLRFRKSIKLAPGIRMNLSGSGVSWTLGTRGASVNVGGRRGAYLNAGIPGSGFSSRHSLGGGRKPAPKPRTVSVELTVSVDEDGTVTFRDAQGRPATDAMIAAAKAQAGDVIRDTLQRTCDEINARIEVLGELHLQTPSPHEAPSYSPRPYEAPAPSAPVPKKPGFIARLFKGKVQRIEAENTEARREFELSLADWKQDKVRHEASERDKASLVASAAAGLPEAMERFFEEVLLDIVWPRETAVSFEVSDSGRRLALMVDLPEIEDMPTKTASVPQRGFKLSVKEMGPTQVQKLYARHIHSIAFRLVGEAFASLPSVQEVTLSGYSQRTSKLTGHLEDEYLLSVVVRRDAWARINFEQLEAIDVVEALAQFELRRTMTKTGVFKAVEPF